LDASLLPPSLSVVPANYATAVAAKEALAPVGQSDSSAFRVQLWTTRGAGATYLDGEDLVVDLTASRDCYIKIYHIDVNGRVSLILPNQYSRDNFIRGGQVYRIPPPGAPYRFLLGKPYGVEFIKVIASTRPFSDIEEPFTDLGPATRGVLERGLSVTSASEGTESGGGAETAAPDALRPTEMAQAMVSYTILGRGE